MEPVRDSALAAALDRATHDLGPIEVLECSPLPQKEFLPQLWHLHTNQDEFRTFAEPMSID